MEKKRLIIMISIIVMFLISIFSSYVYYKGKYKVSFETGTNDIILTKYVSKNSKIKEPSSPVKEGYVFVEWQLNGKKYDFDSEIKSNTVLTAKWAKEEYITIKFETRTSDKIDTKKILKGSVIDDLPKITKEGFDFIGWYLNGNKYENQAINDDVTLYAEYKNSEINTTYKIGDYVLIVGEYAESAFSIDSNYSKAIGWERKIIGIMDDTNYPYIIGNESGITGFFKANSIKKVSE